MASEAFTYFMLKAMEKGKDVPFHYNEWDYAMAWVRFGGLTGGEGSNWTSVDETKREQMPFTGHPEGEA